MDKIQELRENTQKVYDSGYDQGFTDVIEKQEEFLNGEPKTHYDLFWDAFQDYGNRTDYSYAFCLWKPVCYKPKYPIIATGSAMSCFLGSSLEVIGVLDFSEVTSLNTAFYQNSCLKTIEKLIVSEKCTDFGSGFTNCNVLENIAIEGTILANINFRYSKMLNKASIESIINALSDEKEGLTLTLSKAAVDSAFETVKDAADGSTSAEWIALAGDENTEGIRPNWTISLLE